MLCNLWPWKRPSAHSTDAELIALPLHAKHVSQRTLVERLDQMRAIRAFIRNGAPHPGDSIDSVVASIAAFLGKRNIKSSCHGDCSALLHVVDKQIAIFERCLDELENFDDSVCEDVGEAELGAGDISTVTSAHIAEELDNACASHRRVSPVTSTIRTFTTPEKDPPSRRRWVTHPPEFNDSVNEQREQHDDEDIRLHLPHGTELYRRVREWTLGKCVDFAFAFAQFTLPRNIRHKFRFRFAGKMFQQIIIPTGGSTSSQITQAYLTVLGACVIHACGGPHAINIDTYIDNMRILANDPSSMARAVNTLYRLAHAFGLSINEPEEETMQQNGTSYTFLGVQYDHINGTTSLTEKFQAKLEAHQHALRFATDAAWEDITLRQLLSVFGCLCHASGVQQTSRSGYYYAHKFMRRRAAQNAELDKPARPWLCVRPLLLAWLDDTIGEGPHPRRVFWPSKLHQYRKALLYCDASDVGMGAIVYHSDGSAAVVARKWSKSQRTLHINIKEALAFFSALSAFDWSNTDQIEVRIDNTTVIHCAGKGTSRCHHLNAIIGDIWAHSAYCKVVDIAYVNTQSNRADGLSRIGRDLVARTSSPLTASWLAALLK